MNIAIWSELNYKYDMPLSVISDIHVKDTQDEGYQLLLKFLNHPKVLESNSVYFLGDIFDLMVGSHKEHLETFPEFFKKINQFLEEGKDVYYFEGNHDFHLNNILSDPIREKRYPGRLHYVRGSLEKEYWGMKYYFSHGDDIEIGNWSYKLYKKVVRNPFANLLANYVVPFKLVDDLGRKASEKSRKANHKYLFDEEKIQIIRKSFRIGVEKLLKRKPLNFIICGHSHIKDDFEVSSSCKYLNNGFLKLEKTFLFIDQNSPEFISL